MNDFINKFTIYDLIGNVIPGFIIVSCICAVIPEKLEEFINLLDGSVILLILFFGFVSYCVGWIIADFVKIIYDFFKINDKKNDIFKKLGIILLIIILIDYVMFFYLEIICYKIVFINLLYCLFIIISFYLFNEKEKDDICYNYLIKECYRLIRKYHKNFDDEFFKNNTGTEDNILKVINSFGEYANFIIQTEVKYGRIHNFNSSKSFSKNLSGASLVVMLVISCFYINEKNFCYQNIYLFIIIVMMLSFFVLYKRYKMFKHKTELIILSYFVNYLMDKVENGDKDYKGDNIDFNMTVYNNGEC